jgi:hypothetical protein
MPTVKPLTVPTKFLSKALASTAMSFKVNNIKSWGKNALGQFIDITPTDFGTYAYGAFRNANGTLLEIFEFDPSTIASSSITILKRGMNFDGDITTETTSYKLDWPSGTIVQFGTDIPQLLSLLSPDILTGNIAPSTVPFKIGNIFCDTSAGKVYISTGISSSADWKLLN